MPRSVFFLFLALYWILISCEDNNGRRALKKQQFVGETMGTTLSIAYLDSLNLDFSRELTKLLLDINQAASTYIPNSDISRFNQQVDSILLPIDGHLIRNYYLAEAVYQRTDGWFNPCVMPLVNYWGFGYTPKHMVKDTPPLLVDSLLQLVNFEAIRLEPHGTDSVWLIKDLKGVQLDLSACAKGYAVDEVGRLLESLGLEHYFVEIGGEVLARGNTISGMPWRTGIRKPQAGAPRNALQVALELPNLALATSGNYENYYVDSTTGYQYAHTINPHTGYPEQNELLSASVFASNCGVADAYATAFMAMGLEKAYDLAINIRGLDAYFVYRTHEGTLATRQTIQVDQWLVGNKQEN